MLNKLRRTPMLKSLKIMTAKNPRVKKAPPRMMIRRKIELIHFPILYILIIWHSRN